MHLILPITRNITSIFSLLWVLTNLTFWVLILIPISILRWLIPIPFVSRFCFVVVDFVYRMAVHTNSFWMRDVIGIEFLVDGEPNPYASPIVICNHQSWFDIPIVQDLVTRNGPIIKFLIKRELVWVPVIGWICLALNFPRLYRGKDKSLRAADYSKIQGATQDHGAEPGALLVFPEGTRFTANKQRLQASPYERLLVPKSGGMKIIKTSADPATHVMDITIDYGSEPVNIWRCLHGQPKKIAIKIRYYALADIDDMQAWLNERWQEKSIFLDDSH